MKFHLPIKMNCKSKIPIIKKRFLYARDFARASLNDIFSESKIKSSDVLTADYFANSVLMNKGNMNFTTQPLPWLAQLSPFKDAVVINANNDSPA